MCFSATASFTSAALLVPISIYASKIAWSKDSRYLPLALIPLVFGIQQGFEGIFWLLLNDNQANLLRLVALGFLFFSHGFWLVWPSLTALILDHRHWAKKLFLTTTLIGLLFGLTLYVPFLLYPNWLSVTISHGSIDYQTQIIYDRFFSYHITRLIYALIALGPLCLSEPTHLRIFGGLIALSVLFTHWFFDYAFVSVWCFLAAALSVYVTYILYSLPASLPQGIKLTTQS